MAGKLWGLFQGRRMEAEPGEGGSLRILLPRKEFTKAVEDAASSSLGRRGFQQVKKGKWVQRASEEIVWVVELLPLKSAFSAKWGVSLNFVPHLNQTKGFRVEWHQTPEKAQFDLSFNPLDYEKDVNAWSVDQYNRPEKLSSDAESFAEKVAEAAVRFMEPLTSVAAVLKAQEDKRKRHSISLKFEDYPQEVLAYAFVLARLGRARDAESALQQFERSMRGFDDCKGMPREPFVELEKTMLGVNG